MQTDNGSLVKPPTTFSHAPASFVELAAQVAKARGAILWVTGNDPSGIAAATGLGIDASDQRFSVIALDLAEVDAKLDDGAPGGCFVDGKVAGQEILAGIPVAGSDGERLGSLWVLGRKGAASQDGDTLESLRRIAGLIGTWIA